MATATAGMTEEQCERAEEMARSGKTISQIHRALKVPYGEVWNYLHSIEAYSFLGAKRMITRRLNAMVKTQDKAKRKALADEANEMAEYLYYEGKRLGSMVERMRRILD